MSALEQTYRATLRWYPKKWRKRNEDAVLGTLLDVADEDKRTTPAKGELADLRVNGFATRLGPFGRIPAPVRDRAAIIALTLGTVISAAGLITEFTDKQHLLAEIAPLATTARPGFEFAGPFSNLGFAFYLVWVLAFVAVLIGLRRVARILLLASIPLSFLTSKLSEYLHFWLHPQAATIGWLDLLALIAVFGALRAAGLRRTIILWTLGCAAAFTVIYELQITQHWGVFPRADWFAAGFATIMVSIGVLAAIVSGVILSRRRSPWGPAVMLASIPTLPLIYLYVVQNTTWLESIGTVVGVLVLLAVIIALLRLFGLKIRITRT